MNKKIAIYNLNTYPEMSGGSERSCLELAKELISLGENVEVVTLNPFTKGFETLTYDGVKIKKIPLLNIYWPTDKKKKSYVKKIIWNVIDLANFPMCILLALYFKKNNYALIHTNNIKGASPLLFPIMKLFGLKVVHTTRDYYLLDNGAWYRSIDGEHNSLSLKLRRLFKRIFCKSVDYVVYNSKYMKCYHESCFFFDGVKNKVIYNGFDPLVYRENSIIRKLNTKKVFGFIGRVTEEKGLDLLIDGFLKFKNDEFKLIIAGADLEDFLALYPDKREEIEARTDIKFLGVIDNKIFYDSIDCVVVPSKYNEPFGRVAMEAIFMGKSVIVSNKGGLPEQITNGVTGAVCYDGDYYNAMKSIINADNDQNIKPDLELFTINYCAHSYLSVYEEVLNGKK